MFWEGAGAHLGRTLRNLPLARAFLPPYDPEFNPVERLFQEIRRCIEGQVYAILAEKRALVKAYLADLAADPARVKRLCGWDWLVDAIQQLPRADSARWPPMLGIRLTCLVKRSD